jgi:hypothetical protein
MCAEFIFLPKPSWSIFRLALLPGGELLHPMIPAERGESRISANEMPTSVVLTGCNANKFSRTEEEYNSTSRFGQHVTKFDWQRGLAARAPVSGHAAPPPSSVKNSRRFIDASSRKSYHIAGVKPPCALQQN